jgi:plastocyanin
MLKVPGPLACGVAALGAALAISSARSTAQGAPASVGTGTVSGQVRLSALRGRPLPSSAYTSRTVHGAHGRAASELANVVVYLKDAPARAELPAMHAVITQRDEQFEPRVVAITRGSTVEFPNFDPYFHNVFSLSGAATFDLGRYPKGASRRRRFTSAGVVKVFCHLHSHMNAAILVFDHPFFTTASAEGAFTLTGVPPGRYRAAAWHERAGETDVSLTVEAGRMATTAFTLPVLEP